MTPTADFEHAVTAWTEYCATPWGRIRYAVVRETLRRSLGLLGDGPHRVLDVGGADGLDSVPLAEAGHDVTVLDPSPAMLALGEARTGRTGRGPRFVEGGIADVARFAPVDVTLCHFVLHYREDLDADLGELVGSVRPGGLLSVIAPNPVNRVLSTLVRRGPAAARVEHETPTARTVTFDAEVRKLTHEEVERRLVGLGCTVTGRFGGRVANDLLTDDQAKADPGFYAELEELELRLCDQEPFWRIGGFWQLVVTTPGPAR